MKVEDAMHAGIEIAPPNSAVRDIARIMREMDIGCVAIGDESGLIGIVTDRDVVVRSCADGRCGEGTAVDIMSAPVIHCSVHQDVEDAARVMEARQLRRLPVLDAGSVPIGILTIGDIAHCGRRSLAAETIEAVSAHHPDQLVFRAR